MDKQRYQRIVSSRLDQRLLPKHQHHIVEVRELVAFIITVLQGVGFELVGSFQMVIATIVAFVPCTFKDIISYSFMAFVEVVVISRHIVGYDQVPFLLYDLLCGRLCHLCFLLCSFDHCVCLVFVDIVSFASFMGFVDLGCTLPSLVVALGIVKQ